MGFGTPSTRSARHSARTSSSGSGDALVGLDPLRVDCDALSLEADAATLFGRWDEAAETYEKQYPEYVRRGVTASERRLRG